MIIMALLHIVSVLMITHRHEEGGAALMLFALLGFFVAFGLSVKWQPSQQTLTGYIYQRNEKFGYANYDLRYSQNAGMDSQPSFCVESGSEADLQFMELVGEDTKVEVYIPKNGFRLVNNPFACSSFAELKSVE